MQKTHVVELTAEERQTLLALSRKGHLAARQLQRAHLLLLSDEGKTDPEIAEALHVSSQTVYNTRRRFVSIATPRDTERAIKDRPRPGKKRKLDGKQEAMLTALACSKAPDGQSRWSLRLLADRFVALGEQTSGQTGEPITSLSYETVRRVLKKATSNRG